jgi:hypothetical protein
MILARLAVCSALAWGVAGCGGASGPEPSSDDPVVLKLAYFRSLQEPKTKRLEPNYRAVMSESWKDRMGEGPKEPLARAAPGRIFLGSVPDLQMAKYLRRLREFGLEDLRPRRTEELKPEEFGRACVDPQKSSLIRIFTVGTEQGSRSYLYTDQQTSEDTIQKFIKCEAYIMRACEYAVNVRATSDPLPPREPK